MGENPFRLTNQRQIILDFIKENTNHPTVEEVYDNVKSKLPRISKKTVYTNLTFLAKNGLISEVNVKGVYRYEPKLKPHHHILCKECGLIIDFVSDDLVKYSMSISKEIKGFKVDEAATNFYGICKKCGGK
jgi:Fur family ferric uptake transcriptional regulator